MPELPNNSSPRKMGKFRYVGSWDMEMNFWLNPIVLVLIAWK